MDKPEQKIKKLLTLLDTVEKLVIKMISIAGWLLILIKLFQ